MNRKDFFRNIGILGGGLLLAPRLAFSTPNIKSKVYKVESPCFKINYRYNGQTSYKQIYVYTINMSEEELINKYPDKEIFIYGSGDVYIEGLGKKTYTRFWINDYDDIEILSYSNILL